MKCNRLNAQKQFIAILERLKKKRTKTQVLVIKVLSESVPLKMVNDCSKVK